LEDHAMTTFILTRYLSRAIFMTVVSGWRRLPSFTMPGSKIEMENGSAASVCSVWSTVFSLLAPAFMERVKRISVGGYYYVLVTATAHKHQVEPLTHPVFAASLLPLQKIPGTTCWSTYLPSLGPPLNHH